MKPVTDPELIESLKAKRSEVQAPVGAVQDEDLIQRLRNKKEEAVKKAPKETTETQESAVESGSVIGDFLRTAASIGSSILAEPAAGLYGLTALAGTGGDTEAAAEAVATAREALTYSPQTEGAQQNIQTVGEFIAPVGEALETVSTGLGDTVYEWTGSPELAAVAYSLPTAALEIAGVKGAGRIKRLTDADVIKAQKAMLTDPELKYSGSVAEVKLNNKGQLVADKLGEKLVEGGIRENDVAVITNSTRPTQSQMQEMVKVFEQGRNNDIVSMSNKTTKPIGKSITNRLQSLASKRKGLGKRLENLLETEAGQAQIDIRNSLSGLVETLNSEGVKPVLNNKGGISLPDDWHKGTSFDLSTMNGAKKAVQDAFKLIDTKTKNGITTVKEAHKIKKNLDEFIDASKLSESGVPAQTLRRISEMRREINNTLSQVTEYGAINKELSSVISSMAPFEKFLNPGQSWSNAKVSSVVGESLKQLSTDSKYAASLVEDLTEMERYMKKSNMAFGDDPRALIQFRQTLLENFNVEPSVSNASVLGAAGSLAASASLGNTFGAAHDAAKLIRAGVSKRKAKKIAEQNKKNFNMIKAAISKK
jgi:hypothetical protein